MSDLSAALLGQTIGAAKDEPISWQPFDLLKKARRTLEMTREAQMHSGNETEPRVSVRIYLDSAQREFEFAAAGEEARDIIFLVYRHWQEQHKAAAQAAIEHCFELLRHCTDTEANLIVELAAYLEKLRAPQQDGVAEPQGLQRDASEAPRG